MNNPDILKIGTRGSKLALVQANMVAAQLMAVHPGLDVEIIEINTSGDWKPEHGETRLSEAAGGKGLFAKEIERAILDGRVDCGVHSMKDMPSFLPEGLVIEHIPARADPRDAFLSAKYGALEDLPEGAKVGTASLRRQSFVLAKRPDLTVIPIRGNVPTRIQKMKDGYADAIILAYAGLERLGLADEAAQIWEADYMLPAAGQGAVGVEIRDNDHDARALLDAIHDRETGLCVAAERAALQRLDGSCHTPIGAYATLNGNRLHLDVMVGSEDGQDIYQDSDQAEVSENSDAMTLGDTIGRRLKKIVPPDLLAA